MQMIIINHCVVLFKIHYLLYLSCVVDNNIKDSHKYFLGLIFNI